MKDIKAFNSAFYCSIHSSFKSCLLRLEFSLECKVGVTDVTAKWMIEVVLLEVKNYGSWNKSRLGLGRVPSGLEPRGVSGNSSSLERVFVSLVVKIW